MWWYGANRMTRDVGEKGKDAGREVAWGCEQKWISGKACR